VLQRRLQAEVAELQSYQHLAHQERRRRRKPWLVAFRKEQTVSRQGPSSTGCTQFSLKRKPRRATRVRVIVYIISKLPNDEHQG
jgi:hypothetical protein